MSNHFTGLRLGPPEGDTRLDLTDLYAFQSPSDASRTVVILNTNTFTVASEFHPNAVYRINIDTNGDDQTEISFIQTFSEPQDGRQTVTVHLAKGADARSDEPAGEVVFKDVEVSFGPEPAIHTSGDITFFAGVRSDAFFIDFAGILDMFDHKDGKNFTGLDGEPAPSRWTGKDLFANQNCFSMIFEFPTSLLGGNPVRIWRRVSVRKNGQLVAVDRAGHPNLANFFMTDQVKPLFDADEPANDRARYLDHFLDSLQHVGGYSRDEALAVLDGEALLLALHPAATRADTFTVDTLDDTGDGSLSQAITRANARSGADTITFKPGLTGTIALTADLPKITDALTIQGPGRDHLTIDGGKQWRPFFVESQVHLTLEALTIVNGSAPTDILHSHSGGAVYNNGGQVTITDCTLSGNQTTASGSGGAIYNSGGTLTVRDSTFRRNAATGGGTLHNNGSAIYVDGGTLTASDSTFDINDAEDYGGAIYIRANAEVTITDSTLEGNGANADGGAIYNNQSKLTVTTSTILGSSIQGRGGAIYTYYGTLDLTDSLLKSNGSRGNGNALYSEGSTVNITNSTFTDNRFISDQSDGVIYVDADGKTLTITNSTIAANMGGRGALYVRSGSASLHNTLLANEPRDCEGAVTDQRGNIANDNLCNFTPPDSLNQTDPLLEGLKNNGGPTETMALQLMPQRSLAIGKGVDCPHTDQRGVPRPAQGCDSGAFQSGAVPVGPAVTAISPSSGPAAGGTVVTIEGSGFSTAAGATSVRFGPNPATNVSCSATTRCEATSPAGSGSVDVRVTVEGRTSPDTPADSFTYQRGPSPDADPDAVAGANAGAYAHSQPDTAADAHTDAITHADAVAHTGAHAVRHHHRLHGAGQRGLSLPAPGHARHRGGGQHTAAGGHQRSHLQQPRRCRIAGGGRQRGLRQPAQPIAVPCDQRAVRALRREYQ